MQLLMINRLKYQLSMESAVVTPPVKVQLPTYTVSYLIYDWGHMNEACNMINTLDVLIRQFENLTQDVKAIYSFRAMPAGNRRSFTRKCGLHLLEKICPDAFGKCHNMLCISFRKVVCLAPTKVRTFSSLFCRDSTERMTIIRP